METIGKVVKMPLDVHSARKLKQREQVKKQTQAGIKDEPEKAPKTVKRNFLLRLL